MIARLRHLTPKSLPNPSLTRFRLVAGEIKRPFCSKKNGEDKAESESRLTHYDDSYRQLDNLDFMTAAKMVFSDSPRKKKFGFDFHMVQLFFALMPSFAVYLVAQYSRYEMRKMEAQLEVKRKKEEEAKAKELELKAAEEEAAGSEVKTRLEKLEQAVKDIVDESKRHSSSGAVKKQEIDSGKSTSDSEKSVEKANLVGENSAEEKEQGRASHSRQDDKRD